MSIKALVTHHHINLGWSVCMSISYTLRETPWGVPPQYRDFSFLASYHTQFRGLRGWIWSLIFSLPPKFYDSKACWFYSKVYHTLQRPEDFALYESLTDLENHKPCKGSREKGRKKGPCSPNLSSAPPAAGSTSACKSSSTLEAIMEPGSQAKEGCALE